MVIDLDHHNLVSPPGESVHAVGHDTLQTAPQAQSLYDEENLLPWLPHACPVRVAASLRETLCHACLARVAVSLRETISHIFAASLREAPSHVVAAITSLPILEALLRLIPPAVVACP